MPTVEDKIAVREVMQEPRPTALRPTYSLLEQPIGHSRGSRVGRKVQVHRVGAAVETSERHLPRAGQRDRREVVRIAGIGQDDRSAAFDSARCELDQTGLRARKDGNLPGRVDVDSVDIAIADRNCLFQRREAGERGVAVDVGTRGGIGQSLHDMFRGPDLRVSTPEIDERLAVPARRGGDPCEQRGEVLLGQPLDSLRGLAHQAMLWQATRHGAMRALRRAGRRA